MRKRSLILAVGFLLAMVGGYLIARSAAPPVVKPAVAQDEAPKAAPRQGIELDPEFRKRDRPAFKADAEAAAAGALVGQRTLRFRDRAALEAFLAKAGDRVRILGRLDRLNVLRIGFLNPDELTDLLDGTEKLGMIFPAVFPENDSVAAQSGAVGMGSSLLSWLGISGDNSQSGNGVRIAVLDTGVSASSYFGGQVLQMLGSGDVNGHGTAVTSMILGNTSLAPGVAPGTTVLSYQIGDAQGNSDSFRIAEAILAAIDQGVIGINISFGSTGQSDVLSQAIAQAVDAGIIVVAAAGNAGTNYLAYPAADQGVIAVGAVDKNGELMAFSNTGAGLDLVAPGYGINAVYLNDSAVAVSGTSFSSPIVLGLISKAISDSGGKLSAVQAWSLIQANLNEAGAPGYDTEYGYGIPDMSRVANAGTKGIYDAAVASQWVASTNGNTQLQVTIQNRGTETLVNAGVTVTTPAGTNNYNVTTLAVGDIKTFNIPLANTTVNSGSAVQFSSTVALSGSQTDAKPANNRLVESYTSPKKN